MSAFATEKSTTITVDKIIIVDSKEYSIKTNVVIPTATPDSEPDVPSVTYTVCYNLGIDGIVDETSLDTYAPVKVSEGQTVIAPADPTPIIGDFAGWYTSYTYDTLFDFSVPIKEDTTIYAKWIFDETDTDGDGLPDDVEFYLELNPNKPDTDDDGLKDRLELEISTDPKIVDTDSDSITDYDEDYDGDGLTNGNEVELGTSPLYEDSDSDWVSDYEEVNMYKTNPIDEDSDDDGAKDGWEIENGFDPLVYNQSFVVEEKTSPISKINPVSASVSLELPGDKVTSVEITPMDYSDSPLISETIPGYLGQAYDFTTDATFEVATLNFTYDTCLGTIGDAFQPRVYYFNETDGTFEELPNQSVEDGCVMVDVTHFSTYILLNKVEFDKVWEIEIKPPFSSGDSEDEATLDIVFVIDYSLSMEWNDEYQLFKSLSEEFINKLRDGKDKAGAVKFIRRATLVSALTTDKESVITAINGISYDDGNGTYSGTDGSAGIKMALDQMATSDSEYQYIVFITDGEDNGYSYSYDSLIAMANESDVTIYAVGMGSASESVLREISSQTGGKYYHATTGVSVDDLINLDDVFKDIEGETIDLTTDSNNDKIPDYYNNLIKEGILPLSNGSKQFAGYDFNENADYDGEGILNGDELHIIQSGTVVYMEMVSDPTLKHSDNDGVDDYTEVKDGKNPLKEDYYKKGYYKKDDIEQLLNDYCFYYEEIVEIYDDNTSHQVNAAVFSTITGLWNIDSLWRELMIEYFYQYGETVANIDAISEEIDDDIWIDNLDRLLGCADKLLDLCEDLDQIVNIRKDIKDLIDVVRGGLLRVK